MTIDEDPYGEFESIDSVSDSNTLSSKTSCSKIKGRPESMPIAPDSVDALLLYHALECATDPHQVLRESERILLPEGNIVILGFNPISLWGLSRLLRFRSKKVPWSCRILTTRRIKDWLALLGFEVTLSRQFLFLPPVHSQRITSRLQFLEKWGARLWPYLGNVYILTARKKVSTLTPIKPRWRPQRSIVSGLADTASRNGSYRKKCE
jgi:SAM-dependent methyltransferase